MHPVLALVFPAAVLLAATACSLLAPSDADLMRDARQSTAPARGGAADDEPNESDAGEGGAAAVGGAGSSVAPGAAGQGPATAEGGAHAIDFSALIPQEKLALWLMADHGIGQAPGGGVAVWADHSLNEADAKQSLPALQPTLVPAADGVPQMLELSGEDQLVLPKGFSDFSAGLSVFVIASASEDQTCPSLLHLSNKSEQQDIEVGRLRGAIHYEVSEDEALGTESAFGLNQRVLLGVVHAPDAAPELRLNGMFMANGNFTALPEVMPRANNFIGRSLYPDCPVFHGRIGEIIVYERSLSEAEREAVEAYLQGRWNYEPPIKTKPGPGKDTSL